MLADLDQRLRQLQLRTRYPVEHLLAGEYRSVFKGRGMDFDEIRPYTPGDEVRSIDWNVTARTGKPHIKRYIEERELAVWFLVDASASCRHGMRARTKWDTLHELCALLALSAARNNDRTGLILFSDRVEQIVPLRKGRPHTLRLLSDLLRAQPRGRRTDPRAALDALAQLARRRSLVFFMSDFLFDFPDDLFHFAGFRQDFIAIAVNDPHEITPPACGLAAVRDSETGAALVCDFSATHGATYRQTFMARRHALKDHLRSAGTDLIELDTQADCAEALTLFFHNRRRRAADETGG